MESEYLVPLENLNMSIPPDNVYKKDPYKLPHLGYEFQLSDSVFSLFEDVREDKPDC